MSEKETTDVESTLEGKTVSELIEIIHETRSEAKTRRLKEKELNDKLSSIEAKQTEIEQAKKIAEGKKDEVITDLTKKLEEISKDANQWKDYNSKKRAKIKESLKDNWLDSFEIIPLDELEILSGKFNHSETLLDTDEGKKKIGQPGRMEGLIKDLEKAVQKKDLAAQMAIKRLIEQEKNRRI